MSLLMYQDSNQKPFYTTWTIFLSINVEITLTQAHTSRPTWSVSNWTLPRRPSSSAAPATARFQPTSPTTTSSAREPRPPSTHAPTSTSQTAGPVKASGSSATSSLAREVRSVKPRSKIFRPLDGLSTERPLQDKLFALVFGWAYPNHYPCTQCNATL